MGNKESSPKPESGPSKNCASNSQHDPSVKNENVAITNSISNVVIKCDNNNKHDRQEDTNARKTTNLLLNNAEIPQSPHVHISTPHFSENINVSTETSINLRTNTDSSNTNINSKDISTEAEITLFNGDTSITTVTTSITKSSMQQSTNSNQDLPDVNAFISSETEENISTPQIENLKLIDSTNQIPKNSDLKSYLEERKVNSSLQSVNVEDVIQSVQNVIENVESVIEDVETVTGDVENIPKDVENGVIEDVKVISKDVENVSKGVENVIEDVKSVSKNVENVSKDVENATEIIQNFTEVFEGSPERRRSTNSSLDELPLELEEINIKTLNYFDIPSSNFSCTSESTLHVNHSLDNFNGTFEATASNVTEDIMLQGFNGTVDRSLNEAANSFCNNLNNILIEPLDNITQLSNAISAEDILPQSDLMPMTDLVPLNDSVLLKDLAPLNDSVLLKDLAPLNDSMLLKDLAPLNDSVLLKDLVPLNDSTPLNEIPADNTQECVCEDKALQVLSTKRNSIECVLEELIVQCVYNVNNLPLAEQCTNKEMNGKTTEVIQLKIENPVLNLKHSTEINLCDNSSSHANNSTFIGKDKLNLVVISGANNLQLISNISPTLNPNTSANITNLCELQDSVDEKLTDKNVETPPLNFKSLDLNILNIQHSMETTNCDDICTETSKFESTTESKGLGIVSIADNNKDLLDNDILSKLISIPASNSTCGSASRNNQNEEIHTENTEAKCPEIGITEINFEKCTKGNNFKDSLEDISTFDSIKIEECSISVIKDNGSTLFGINGKETDFSSTIPITDVNNASKSEGIEKEVQIENTEITSSNFGNVERNSKKCTQEKNFKHLLEELSNYDSLETEKCDIYVNDINNGAALNISEMTTNLNSVTPAVNAVESLEAEELRNSIFNNIEELSNTKDIQQSMENPMHDFNGKNSNYAIHTGNLSSEEENENNNDDKNLLPNNYISQRSNFIIPIGNSNNIIDLNREKEPQAHLSMEEEISHFEESNKDQLTDKNLIFSPNSFQSQTILLDNVLNELTSNTNLENSSKEDFNKDLENFELKNHQELQFEEITPCSESEKITYTDILKQDIDMLLAQKNSLIDVCDIARSSIEQGMEFINSTCAKERSKLIEATIYRKNLIIERDQALEDLRNVEKAFSELMVRYNKAKVILEQMKENEVHLNQKNDYNIKEINENNEAYDMIRDNANEQLDVINEELLKIQKEYDAEKAAVTAMVRKSEIKLRSLTTTLDQLASDNYELLRMCEEFGYKKS